jgi:hypothetical protein
MGKICFFGALVLLIIIQSPFVFSINCDSSTKQIYNACLEIANSRLNESDKILLISNLEYKNNLFPDHFLVFVKNNFNIGNPPSNVSVQNNGYISNAWMKIFTLMPSINYSNELYVPENTKILTGFNYTLNPPNDYYSNGYPDTLNGDCKTIHRLVKNEGVNRVYIGGAYQGQGKLVPLIIKEDSIIQSIYTLEVSYGMDHYSWRKYLCGYKNRDWCYSCDYRTDEIKTDKIEIKDSIQVKFYNNSLIGEISEVISKQESNKIQVNYSDSLEVSLGNSNYNFYKYLFELYYSFPPYNVLTIKAKDYNSEELNNLFREQDFLVVNSLENCNLKVFDFFKTIKNNCSIENSFIGLRISSEKYIYKENESLIIDIFPRDLLVNISYANKNYLAKNSLNLIVESNYNKIYGEYGSESSEKIIYVKKDKINSFFYKFFWVIFVLVFLYLFIKNYWGRIWKNVAY